MSPFLWYLIAFSNPILSPSPMSIPRAGNSLPVDFSPIPNHIPNPTSIPIPGNSFSMAFDSYS